MWICSTNLATGDSVKTSYVTHGPHFRQKCQDKCLKKKKKNHSEVIFC